MQYITDQEMDRLHGSLGEQLMREPRIQLRITGTPEDIPWEGGINGYFFRIPRGVPVQVPESLARLIQENARAAELSRAGVREYSAGRGKRLGA